jgi:hypothetical protein
MMPHSPPPTAPKLASQQIHVGQKRSSPGFATHTQSLAEQFFTLESPNRFRPEASLIGEESAWRRGRSRVLARSPRFGIDKVLVRQHTIANLFGFFRLGR